MSATFDPLRAAVQNKKKILSAQIAAHYDNLKPRLAETVKKCKQQLKNVEKVWPA